MAIRGILFDKDGTLLDYHRTWMPLNRAVAQYAAGGDPKLAETLLERTGYDAARGRVCPGTVLAAGTSAEIAAAFAALLPAGAPSDLPEVVARTFRGGQGARAVIVEGLERSLQLLRQAGYRLGVATNDNLAGLDSVLREYGLADQFAFRVAADSGFGSKPAPGMVEAFCSACTLRPSEVCVVGDDPHDMEMARRSGAGLAIGVLTGTGTQSVLAPLADVVLESIAALPAYLAKQRRTDGL